MVSKQFEMALSKCFIRASTHCEDTFSVDSLEIQEDSFSVDSLEIAQDNFSVDSLEIADDCFSVDSLEVPVDLVSVSSIAVSEDAFSVDSLDSWWNLSIPCPRVFDAEDLESIYSTEEVVGNQLDILFSFNQEGKVQCSQPKVPKISFFSKIKLAFRNFRKGKVCPIVA